jgi:pilus assembly protein CpaF
MVLMAGTELTLRAIREQVSSAVDLVVHMDRMRDGTRRVTNVTEVQAMEGDTIVLQDIFEFKQTGVVDGKVMGKLVSTGLRPKFSEKFVVNNIELPAEIYMSEEQAL